jgi:hypothetical protein
MEQANLPELDLRRCNRTASQRVGGLLADTNALPASLTSPAAPGAGAPNTNR